MGKASYLFGLLSHGAHRHRAGIVGNYVIGSNTYLRGPRLARESMIPIIAHHSLLASNTFGFSLFAHMKSTTTPYRVLCTEEVTLYTNSFRRKPHTMLLMWHD